MIRPGYQLLCVCLASTARSAQGFPSPSPNTTRLSTLSSLVLAKRGMSTDPSNSISTNTGTETATATETETDTLSFDNTNANTMTEKSWRALLEVSIARSRKIRGSNYVQLSTVESGEPRCRTVVFRGFLKLPTDHLLANQCDEENYTCLIKMCTDLRSKKVEQNQGQPIAELVWWFPKTSEQYRVRGPLILVGDESEDNAMTIARKELWGNLSDPARESFLGQLVPGVLYRGEEDAAQIPPGGRNEEGKPVPPPKNFLLMLLDPTNVDYLRLSGDQYRQADERSKAKDWSYQRVNP